MNILPLNLNFWKQLRADHVSFTIGLVGLFGLILLLAITTWAWKMATVTTYERNLAAFDALTADNGHAMRSRLDSYRQSLDGGAALFEASQSVSLAEWKAYVSVLNIEKTLPGINGIGFIQPFQRTNIESYLQSARERGVGKIEIHPVTEFSEVLSITYIEPIETNREAVGLDIGFEANRREAAYRAKDTGKATITKRIFLVQDETRSAGFLLLRPMYKQGHPLANQQQRREAFRGWVYAPFIASRLMDGLTNTQGTSLNIEVYDGNTPGPSNLIFASDGEDTIAQKSLYSITRDFSIMGQNWTVVWKSTPEFEASVSSREPFLILVGGAMVSSAFLIMMLFYARRETYVRNEVRIKTEELVQKEREVSHALARAESATQAKSKFLANMSHEIRTPMNGVIGFTQLLDNGKLDDKQQRYVQMISESGSVMMNLLNDILDISKVDAGLMELSIEPLNLRHVLQNCMKMVSPSAETKGLELIMEVDSLLPEMIKGDALRLRQILLNLLANAVKFTDKGHVRLAVRYMPIETHRLAEVSILISDTGIGIAPDRQAAVFEPFQQADDSTARKYGGTGLGLSISNQLVHLMGGEMSMDSQVFKGTQFTVKIPVDISIGDSDGSSANQDKQSNKAPKSSAVRKKRAKILMAEDHDVNQMLLSDMLTNLEFDFVIADNGVDAIAIIGQAKQNGEPFDLVLMDIQMPYIDGLNATEIIRNNGISATELPIIALTANAYAQDIKDCLSVGMQAHLAKPFSIESLRDLLATWLDGDADKKAA